MSSEGRKLAKQYAKVAPATFQCQNPKCRAIVYTGTKDLDSTNLKEEFDNVIKGKIHMDHIDPVIPVEGFPNKAWDWNVYISRMFCPSDGFQALCASCHKEKTDKENRNRRKKK